MDAFAFPRASAAPLALAAVLAMGPAPALAANGEDDECHEAVDASVGFAGFPHSLELDNTFNLDKWTQADVGAAWPQWAAGGFDLWVRLPASILVPGNYYEVSTAATDPERRFDNTQMIIYRGGCDGLEFVRSAQNGGTRWVYRDVANSGFFFWDNARDYLMSATGFQAEAGADYHIVVQGYYNFPDYGQSAGPFTMTISELDASIVVGQHCHEAIDLAAEPLPILGLPVDTRNNINAVDMATGARDGKERWYDLPPLVPGRIYRAWVDITVPTSGPDADPNSRMVNIDILSTESTCADLRFEGTDLTPANGTSVTFIANEGRDYKLATASIYENQSGQWALGFEDVSDDYLPGEFTCSAIRIDAADLPWSMDGVDFSQYSHVDLWDSSTFLVPTLRQPWDAFIFAANGISGSPDMFVRVPPPPGARYRAWIQPQGGFFTAISLFQEECDDITAHAGYSRLALSGLPMSAVHSSINGQDLIVLFEAAGGDLGGGLVVDPVGPATIGLMEVRPASANDFPANARVVSSDELPRTFVDDLNGNDTSIIAPAASGGAYTWGPDAFYILWSPAGGEYTVRATPLDAGHDVVLGYYELGGSPGAWDFSTVATPANPGTWVDAQGPATGARASGAESLLVPLAPGQGKLLVVDSTNFDAGFVEVVLSLDARMPDWADF